MVLAAVPLFPFTPDKLQKAHTHRGAPESSLRASVSPDGWQPCFLNFGIGEVALVACLVGNEVQDGVSKLCERGNILVHEVGLPINCRITPLQ